MPLKQVFLLQATSPQKQVLRNLEHVRLAPLPEQKCSLGVRPRPPLPWRFAKVKVMVAKGCSQWAWECCPSQGTLYRSCRHLVRCRSKALSQGVVLFPRKGAGAAGTPQGWDPANTDPSSAGVAVKLLGGSLAKH